MGEEVSETPLLPCPFGCGAPVLPLGDSWVDHSPSAECPIRGPIPLYVWNRRAPLLSPEEREALARSARVMQEVADKWPTVGGEETAAAIQTDAATIRALLARTEAKP